MLVQGEQRHDRGMRGWRDSPLVTCLTPWRTCLVYFSVVDGFQYSTVHGTCHYVTQYEVMNHFLCEPASLLPSFYYSGSDAVMCE